MYLIIQTQLTLAAGCIGQISIAATLFSIIVTILQRIILYCVICSVLLTKFLSMALIFTRCQPIERLWMGQIVDGSCESFDTLVKYWMFAARGLFLVLT